jgi:hypothetical protein
VGASFGPDGKASIPELTFDSSSQPANDIANSAPLKSAVSVVIDGQLDAIRRVYATNGTLQEYKHDVPEITPVVVNFGGLQPFNDLFLALGSATLSGPVEIRTIKALGKICVPSIRIAGAIDDLYDFRYFGDLAVDLSAAILEFGWSSGLGPAGAVSWTTVKLNHEITWGLCYD